MLILPVFFPFFFLPQLNMCIFTAKLLWGRLCLWQCWQCGQAGTHRPLSWCLLEGQEVFLGSAWYQTSEKGKQAKSFRVLFSLKMYLKLEEHLMSNFPVKPLRDKSLEQGMILMQSLAHMNSEANWDLKDPNFSCCGQAMWEQDTRDSPRTLES